MDQALCDRLVCGLRSEATQKRLLAEKDLTLATAQEIAVGMEAAAKQASELQVSSKGLEVNGLTVDNSKPCRFSLCKKGTHRKIVTSKGKNAEIVVNRVTLTKYAGHSQQSQLAQLRKATPPQAGNHQSYFVEPDELGLFTVKDATHSGIFIELSINGTLITMTLDTGASIGIISEQTYQTQLPHLHLHKSDILLRTYTGETLTVCGETQVCITYKKQQYHLPLVIVEGNGPPLFGRNWLQQITLDWKEISMVMTNLDALLQRYHSLFKDELGTMVWESLLNSK